jgi:hypothetical protein
MENEVKISELTDRQLMVMISNVQTQIMQLNVQHDLLQKEFERRVNESSNQQPVQ